MSSIVIFGNREMAELAHYYVNQRLNSVPAFTVHGDFIKEDTFCGKPVVPFEEIKDRFPPDQYMLFAPIYSFGMNKARRNIFNQGKELGYTFYSYRDNNAIIAGNSTIGENCFIFEGVNIQPFVTIGDNVIIWSFSHIGHHSTVGDHVFMSGNVVVAGKCKIGNQCVIGTNVTFRDGIQIGDSCFIGQHSSLIGNIGPYKKVTVDLKHKIRDIESPLVDSNMSVSHAGTE